MLYKLFINIKYVNNFIRKINIITFRVYYEGVFFGFNCDVFGKSQDTY